MKKMQAQRYISLKRMVTIKRMEQQLNTIEKVKGFLNTLETIRVQGKEEVKKAFKERIRREKQITLKGIRLLEDLKSMDMVTATEVLEEIRDMRVLERAGRCKLVNSLNRLVKANSLNKRLARFALTVKESKLFRIEAIRRNAKGYKYETPKAAERKALKAYEKKGLRVSYRNTLR